MIQLPISEFDKLIMQYRELREQNEKLRATVALNEEQLSAQARKIRQLREVLSEMLESFTEPEDDNDILRRARAALATE